MFSSMSVKNIFLAVAGAFLVLVLGFLSATYYRSTYHRQALVKEALIERLVVPDSVKFRNVWSTSTLYVCGEYSAKNALGVQLQYAHFSGSYFRMTDEVSVQDNGSTPSFSCSSPSERGEYSVSSFADNVWYILTVEHPTPMWKRLMLIWNEQ